MKNIHEALADLVQEVALYVSFERGAICAVDCLRVWNETGMPDRAMHAWERYLKEVRDGKGHTDTLRYGAWVPAIPEQPLITEAAE